MLAARISVVKARTEFAQSIASALFLSRLRKASFLYSVLFAFVFAPWLFCFFSTDYVFPFHSLILVLSSSEPSETRCCQLQFEFLQWKVRRRAVFPCCCPIQNIFRAPSLSSFLFHLSTPLSRIGTSLAAASNSTASQAQRSNE